MTSTFSIIPAIDLLAGNVVRLTQGDYGQVSHYDIGPAELAKHYVASGASRIHVVDLDGAKAGKIVNIDAIRAIRQSVDCEIEVGGGIRDEASLKMLFELGITYAILGSILVKDPAFTQTQVRHFPGKIIAGLDCKKDKVAIHGWIDESDISLLPMLEKLQQEPFAGLIYTDIEKDGTLTGPNLEMLGVLGKKSPFPVIASGGIGKLSDVDAVSKLEGVSGCIIGKAILSGDVLLKEAIALERSHS